MKITEFPEYAEKLVTARLANGLTVKVFPKKDFHKTAALLRVEFGSIDESFASGYPKNVQKFPAGVAHFLEHKMFEQPNHDAFETFSHLGADANAFTTYTSTNYLFSTVFNVKENLETLLDFVQEPYFQPAAVEREKNIIGQEIKMYADDVNSALYAGTLAQLYPQHPLANDIAGTLTSISKITAADLLTCYHAFYRPQNMSLLVAGAVEPQEVIEWIENNQAKKVFEPGPKIYRPDLTAKKFQQPALAFKKVNLPTKRSRITFGIKGLDPVEVSSSAGLRYSLALELGCCLLLGELSDNYQQLYQSGLIDDSFNFEIQVDRGFHYIIVSAQTDFVQQLFDELKRIFATALDQLPTAAEQFKMAKRDLLGGEVELLDSIESILNEDQGLLFGQATIFDQLQAVKELTLAEVCQTLAAFLKTAQFSKFQIDPKGVEVKQ